MAHNGGVLQVNLASTQVGGDYPFLNNMKNNQVFARRDNTTPLDLTKQDANGYMHTLYGTGEYTVFFVPSQADRPGNYKIIWDGDGTIHYGSGALVSGSFTSSGGALNNSCMVAVTAAPDDQLQVLGVSGVGSPHITNIRFVHVDDVTDEAAGFAYIRLGTLPPGDLFFGKKFLARLREANFGVIRFLNVCGGNGLMASKWADYTPVSYRGYNEPHFPLTDYAGITGGTGDDYTATLSGFTLVDKAKAIVRYDRTSVGASPTMNISGTGAKVIKDQLFNGNNDDTINFTVRYPTINLVGYLTYDEDLDCYVMSGGSSELGIRSVYGGWPPAICFLLCTTVGAHCSMPISAMSLDPETDLLTELATLARDTFAGTGLKFQAEGPNECWNTASQFRATYFAWFKEKVRNGGTDFDWHQWYGRAMSKIGKTMSTVFSGDRTKYDVICAVQTYSGAASGSDHRMNSTRYVTETGNASDAAKNWVTQVHCAGYWNASYYGTATETTAVADYAAAGTAAAKAAVVDTYMSDDSGPRTDELEDLYVRYGVWAAWVATFPGVVLGQYEGGYSPDYAAPDTGGNIAINNFREACKNWPRMYEKTIQNYRTFKETHGGVMPSVFQMSSDRNSWSVLDPDVYAADPEQWTAIKHYPTTTRRYRLQCTV